MKLTDQLRAPRGVLEVRMYRGGELVHADRESNMILTSLAGALARLLAGEGAGQSVAQIGFGTDGNGPSPDDTALSNAYTKSVDGYDYPEPNQVRFQWSLSTAEANGKSIREFGLIAGDGTLLTRKTRGAIEKADDISLAGSWTLIF